jgi:hypothetical protein
VLAVKVRALLDVGQREDLVDRVVAAVVDQLHHELVVRHAEILEAPEARARVHQVVQQHPAFRVEDLVERELRRVGLVDRVHQLGRNAREAARTAEVVVDHARGRRRFRVDDEVLRLRGARAA